ncbi:thioesterase domain-containing protein, partial [Gordonia paraffinivorans]|uniref:thioesterase domain-containing protein n=1 Tax=Gordonia paraffinivorans TaxID=175628 RepID=UPI00242B11B1
VVVGVERLPLTANGKLDRKALPDPVFEAAEYVAPANDTERVLVEVFTEVLNVAQVSVTESFFDLGGNSLLAARVVSRVRQRGLPFELRWLFSEPTIRELARRIESGGGLQNDVLIPLRAEGSRPPLFCIHPAGGLAWFYGGFAQYVADRPIYGLQDPHVVNGEPPAEEVDDIATRYVEEIRRIQPDGPYHLLGWSIGGMIAHAMATRLQSDGDQVAYLGIMDTSPVSADGEVSAADGAATDRDLVDVDRAADILGGWRDLFDLDSTITAQTAEEVAGIVRMQIAGMGLLAEDMVDRVMHSFEAAPDLAMRFRPKQFQGAVHIFTATADKENPELIAESWRDYVSGEVKNVYVATHHLGMADAASLAVIGPCIERVLSEGTDSDAQDPTEPHNRKSNSGERYETL